MKAIYYRICTNKSLIWLFVALCVFNIIHAALFLDHPFCGQNSWRDAQTFGVARNFLEEENNLLQPSYDIRNSSDGRLPGEFPFQTWYCALLMKLTAKDLLFARLSNFLLGLMTAAMLYAIMSRLKDKLVGITAALMFLSNPLAGSQMISVMPETMVNFLSVLTIFFYFFIKKESIRWPAVILTLSICTLVKPSGFVLAVFILMYDILVAPQNKKKWIVYFALFIIPVLCLKWWINYTMQFENSAFLYPITHHYVRDFSYFLNDFGWEVIYSSFEKTLRHAFNIAGLLGLALLIFSAIKYKNITPNKANALLPAAFVWIAGSIAFLFYAGNVQTVQLYYASVLIIPAILLTSEILVKNIYLRGLTILILALQTNIKVNTFRSNYSESKDQWETMRLEKITDTFSTRDDLFIVYPFHSSDFTMLGRLGRRGYNFDNPGQFTSGYSDFKYLCLTDTLKRSEIIPFTATKLTSYGGYEFYSLPSSTK